MLGNVTARLGIGLPVYNGERYLAQTIASLQAQTYGDFEVLILDNASTDSSPDIALETVRSDSRFRYERKPVTTGGPQNFNDVFARMDNELFAWCAADDLHHPDFYSASVRALDALPGAIGGFTAVEMIDNNNLWVRDDDPPMRFSDPDPGTRMTDLVGFGHACQSIFSVYRRTTLAAVEPMCVCWGSDRVMLAEIVLHGPIAIDPGRYFRNRDHDERVTHGKGRSRSYYGGAQPYKAITFHYASHLRRAIRNAPLSAADRESARRAYARWTMRNTRNFARSAARYVIESTVRR
jgi:glycosyltransferase involved in cell wall biosynthesis